LQLTRVKGKFQDIFFDLGYMVDSSKHPRNHRQFLRYLNKLPIKIESIFDIGAFMGEWTLQAQRIFRKASFQLFDPNPYLKINPIKINGNFHNVLLSDSIKVVEYYNNYGTGDSYYKEISKFYDEVPAKIYQTTSLDELRKTTLAEVISPSLIKIDTQGSELDIISGAKSYMNDLKVVITELPISKYNLGAPNFLDYLTFFSELNFFPFQIVEVHRIDKEIIQVDIAFLRNDLKHLV
jgi:FkbM family methyltransferase